VRLQERMLDDFKDHENGGFYMTAAAGLDLPVRPKSLYDGAIPSANSMALLNLLQLSRMTGRTPWADEAAALSRSVSGSVNAHPSGYAQLLIGIDAGLGPCLDVVLAGDPNDPSSQAMLSVLNERFYPHHVVLFKSSAAAEALARIAGFTAPMNPVDGNTAAYVCRDFACSRPVTDAGELAEMIGEKS